MCSLQLLIHFTTFVIYPFRAVYLTIPFYFLLCPLMALIGLVMFAHFKNCDPLASGRITKPDQVRFKVTRCHLADFSLLI